MYFMENNLNVQFHCFLHSSYDYFENLVNLYRPTPHTGRDSSVDTATRYGLNGPGIEAQWEGGGENFCIRPDHPWGPPSLLYNWYLVLSRG
jgi:hypothetical protein